MNSVLYILTVLIWGSTWIAIALQAGDVEAVVSIFYRFVLAAVLFFPVLLVLGKLQKTQVRDHLFFFLQGACLFSLNFVCFYTASHYMVSGLMSVIFALAALFNTFNQWLIWRKRPPVSIYVASVLGVGGLIILFWPQWQQTAVNSDLIYGVLFSVVGTYLFSLGNMISVRHNQHNIQPWTGSAYGIIYGAIILAVIIVIFDLPLVWDQRPLYLASLLYLTIPGTILGFSVYLMLVARIGASQAAYTTVLFPILALTISTLVEDYQWDIMGMIGLVLVMFGVCISIAPQRFLAVWAHLLGRNNSIPTSK